MGGGHTLADQANALDASERAVGRLRVQHDILGFEDDAYLTGHNPKTLHSHATFRGADCPAVWRRGQTVAERVPETGSPLP